MEDAIDDLQVTVTVPTWETKIKTGMTAEERDKALQEAAAVYKLNPDNNHRVDALARILAVLLVEREM